MERYRTTIILVAVLVILAGVAFFLNNRNENTATTDASATATPDPSKHVWIDDEDVISIDVLSGTQKVLLRKDVTTTVWSLVEPIQADADPFAVGGVADQLKALAATTVLTGVTDLAQYGLDKSGLTVLVRTGGSKPGKHTLHVGNTTIDGSGYYARVDDSKDKVYIVSNVTIEPIKSWLTTPPKAQPSPTPLPPVAPTDTLTITVPITTTGTVTTTESITNTAPGAANPTTPLPASPTAQP